MQLKSIYDWLLAMYGAGNGYGVPTIILIYFDAEKSIWLIWLLNVWISDLTISI